MISIIRRNLKDNFTQLLIYILTAIAFAWMYVAIFPSMLAESEKLAQAFQSYPEGIFKAMGISLDQIAFTNLEAFLSMENFSIMWPIMAIALCTSLASNALAGEIEKGTIVISLSQPITRIQYFFSRYFAGLLSIIVFVGLSIFTVIPLAKLHSVTYRLDNYLSLAVLGLLFCLAIYSLSFLFSSIVAEKGKALFLTVGLMVLMYAIKIVSSLKDNLQDLKYVSFFYYYDQYKALVQNQISAESILVFAGVALASTILAVIVFAKRDISV